MASSKSAARNEPWYRRWFSRPARTSTVASVPSAAPARPMYYCAECRFGSKLRGVVYDHIKSFHKEILDRHSRIIEETPSAA